MRCYQISSKDKVDGMSGSMVRVLVDTRIPQIPNLRRGEVR